VSVAAVDVVATPGPVAVVADAHLEGPGGDFEPLLDQLRGLPGKATRLVLLGDIVHVWVGFPQFQTPAARALVDTLVALRRAGVAVDSIEGNRDFFLAEGPAAVGFDRLGTELGITVGERRYLFVHGDGLDDNDRQYRAWRALSKSPPVRLLVRHLPARLADRLVRSTERQLAQTNFKHRVVIPEAAIRRFAERRLETGFDEVVLGHFHEERRFEVAGGRVHILEAWFSSRRLEWLGP
jgi:UDP-2,3-diacylglucosamine pyrophosphatase LpxH